MVRAGKNAEREQAALEQSLAIIGWDELPDLSSVRERSELSAKMASAYPDEKPSTIANWAGQVWTFAKIIAVGDLIAMPLKGVIAFGEVTGGYVHDPLPGWRHAISVKWLRSIPRVEIDQDLLYSLGAIMTVCRIERNDAENRIRALLGKDASYTAAREPQAGVVAADVRTEQSDVLVNLDELAQDAIRKHIARNFSGHDLAGLVEAVLQAQGYKTHLSPPGPDGGVDVLCGTGVHGFDSPRLAVQVKSGGIEVDTGIFREFQGVMRNFGADHGLIVSWGGYKTNVRREMQREFFRVRMWGQNELIDEILRVYEDLPAAIKAKLPLKRSWILMQTSEEIT